MANETIRLSETVPAPPERVYAAWLDGETHGAFIDGKVSIDPRSGGHFRVEWPGGSWDGHIEGVLDVLEPGRRIVKRWRSTAFPAGHGDSRVEIDFEAVPEGTRLTLVHSDLPEGTGDYFGAGWTNAYLAPLVRYFEGGAAHE